MYVPSEFLVTYCPIFPNSPLARDHNLMPSLRVIFHTEPGLPKLPSMTNAPVGLTMEEEYVIVLAVHSDGYTGFIEKGPSWTVVLVALVAPATVHAAKEMKSQYHANNQGLERSMSDVSVPGSKNSWTQEQEDDPWTRSE